MAGGKKSSFTSAFNFFRRKPRRAEHDYYTTNYDDFSSVRKVYPSDEDGRGPWRVADPGVDTKISDFIAHFYATRVTEPDHICQSPANA